MKKIFSVVLVLISLCFFAQQKPAYWDDIQHFKQLDQDNPPPQNAILFLGSSSFTKWTDVADYFPDKTIINRGFGGSTLFDLNVYSDDLLKPYHPKQIVIYCGENDIADNAKPKVVLKRFKEFYKKLRQYYPNIPVDYVSAKYSPSREQYWDEITEVNTLIKNYISKQKNTEYIDITKVMEGSDGKVRSDIFLEDRLHMKPEGYELWTKVMKPYLK